MSEAETRVIDWELIEKDWRAGVKSVLQIANENGISHTAINKRFKKLGIPRDKAAKIKAKTDELVSMQAVSTKVSTETKVSDVEVIEANAKLQAGLILGQRKDARRGRELVTKLFAELEFSTDNLELLEQIGFLMASPDEAGIDKLNDLYRKIISLPGRVDMAKKLAEALEKMVNIERRVFNIKEENGEEQPPRVTEIRLVAVRPGHGRVLETKGELNPHNEEQDKNAYSD